MCNEHIFRGNLEYNRIGGVMVRVLVMTTVDCEFKSLSIYNLVFVAFSLSMQTFSFSQVQKTNNFFILAQF
jgi:hypothetical protein